MDPVARHLRPPIHSGSAMRHAAARQVLGVVGLFRGSARGARFRLARPFFYMEGRLRFVNATP